MLTSLTTLNYFYLQFFRVKDTKCRKTLRAISQMSPPLMFLILIYLTYIRFKFTTQVCLCDFKDDYFTLRKRWYETDPTHESKDPGNPKDYYCYPKASLWYTILLGYEAIITGLHLISVMYQYF